MMKTEAHSDVGTVLQPDEFCGIWSPTEGYYFLMPDQPSEARLPDAALALIAAVMRLHDDEDFRQEVVDWWLAHAAP